jgi:diacylglycerol kinase family enzyme
MNADRSTPSHADAVGSDSSSDADLDTDAAGADDTDDDAASEASNDGAGDTDRWLILNPASGEGGHADRVRRLAADRGFRVVETEGEGDAARYAREAVRRNVRELAVCGGDGTLQEALSGLVAAGVIRPVDDANGEGDAGNADDTNDAETAVDDEGTIGGDGDSASSTTGAGSTADSPVLSVIPAGTANIFAEDMGITGIDGGFETFDGGEVRRLDVGLADGEPFVKSCIAGLTADTSSATSNDLKERFGSLAFVITGVERAASFDPLDIEIEVDARAVDPDTDTGVEFDAGTGEWTWQGEALCLVIGNARRYAGRVGQANVEDGLLDVTIVEEMPPSDVVTEAIGRQLLGRETENVTRLQARRIDVEAAGDEPIEFSLDGEIADHDRLAVTVCERAVPVRVGPTYEPDPDDP